MAARKSSFRVVDHTRIAIDYMSTFQHRRVCVFTIADGAKHMTYLWDVSIDIGNITDTQLRRHLLDSRDKATLIKCVNVRSDSNGN